jgi:hypothetical protein
LVGFWRAIVSCFGWRRWFSCRFVFLFSFPASCFMGPPDLVPRSVVVLGCRFYSNFARVVFWLYNGFGFGCCLLGGDVQW